MPTGPEQWLESLPPALSRQRAVIERLLKYVRADGRVRLFAVGCSIGRGAADSLSDVDAVVGVRELAFDDAVRTSVKLVRAGGKVLDLFQQVFPATIPGGHSYQHTYAHYADGVELDLSVVISRSSQPRPDWVVLYDPDQTVSGQPTTKLASAEDVRSWGFNCLVRLHACAKYLERGSLWEAHLMIERARADFWCVWATAEGVADPLYGVTAVLDDPRKPVPAGIEKTVALLSRPALAQAALSIIDLLTASWPRAGASVGLSSSLTSTPLVGHVTDELRRLFERSP